VADPYNSAIVVFENVELVRPDFVASEDKQIPIRRHLQDVLDRNSDQELATMLVALVEYVSSLARLRPTKLQCGQPILGEAHLGTISHVTDSGVIVRYGSGEDQFELEYSRSQFFDGATLERGDSIEACVALWREPYKPQGVDRYLSEEEQSTLNDAWDLKKGVVGDLDL